MMLFNVFRALHPQTSLMSFSSTEIKELSTQILTQDDLKFARSKITTARRDAPTLRDEYDVFLTHCHHALEQQSQTHVLRVIINYLSDDTLRPEHLYRQTNQLLELFKFNLQTQTDTASLTTLGYHFIDKPQAFAALLIYLIQNNVSPEQVLQTHIMQDYLRYYLGTLSLPNNPVNTLYTALAYYPEVHALVEHSKKICCPGDGLSSYALDGTTHVPDTLEDLPIHRPMVNITPEEDNLEALYRVFDVPFLVDALQWYFDDGEKNLSPSLLSSLFNGEHLTHHDITLLLPYLREKNHLKQTLATHMNKQTLTSLVKGHVSGVSSLIPYSDHLASIINGEDFNAYVDGIKQNSTCHFDLISDLSALLKQFKRINASHSLIAFHALIEIVVEHPDVLDDLALRHQLRKFPQAKAQLSKYSGELERSFDAFITSHTRTSLEDFDYISVEDRWRNLHPKLAAIQAIETIPNTFPRDKYKLQCRLLKALLAHNQATFDVHVFIEKLGLEPIFHEDNITVYERLHLEMLVSIDHEALRLDLISRLNTNIPETRIWQNVRYDNNSLYMHATRHGNLGFIMWLEASKIKHRESYEELATTAADLGHWPLVQYIHATHPLQKLTVDLLLKFAIEQNAAEAILPLWQGKKHAPRLPTLDTSFKRAVEKNYANCVAALLSPRQLPCDTSLAQGYRYALKNNQTAILDLIINISEKKHLPCLNDAIAQASRHRQSTPAASSKLPALPKLPSYDTTIGELDTPRVSSQGLFGNPAERLGTPRPRVFPPVFAHHSPT